MKNFNWCWQTSAQDLLPLHTVMKGVEVAVWGFIFRKDVFPEECHEQQLSVSVVDVSLETCLEVINF